MITLITIGISINSTKGKKNPPTRSIMENVPKTPRKFSAV
jgi:hypothetical protein